MDDADPRSRGFRDAADEAQWQEQADTEEWMEAGAPSAMAMWRMLRDLPSAEAPGELPPPLNQQSMALLPLDLVRHYLGGISPEAFDKHVRRRVHVQPIGNRIFVTRGSVIEFVRSGAYKSLA